MRALLERYGLERALDIPWLDGRWSEVWPLIRRMSELKEHDPTFLDAAQRLRDAALDEIETLAVEATQNHHATFLIEYDQKLRLNSPPTGDSILLVTSACELQDAEGGDVQDWRLCPNQPGLGKNAPSL